MNSKHIALMALIAAAYAVTTIILAPISYELIQVRLSEILTPLPFYFGLPAVFGLIIGCFVANIYSPFGILDIVLGTMGTVCGAIASWKSKHLWQACLAPVISNAIWVGILLQYYGIPFVIGAAAVGVGELVACTFIGYPLMKALERIIPSIMFATKTSLEDRKEKIVNG